MTRRQLNLVEMGQNVLAFLDKSPASWNHLLPLTQSVEKFRTVMNALTVEAKRQRENVTTGHTMDKEAMAEKVVDQVYALCIKLRPFAKLTGDHALLQKVDYSYSGIAKLNDLQLAQTAEIIAQEVSNRLEQLKPYLVSDTDITALNDALDTYRPMSSIRNVMAGGRQAATSNIVELITEMRHHLDMMDDLVEALIPDAEFTKTYFIVRKINDKAGRGAQVKEG